MTTEQNIYTKFLADNNIQTFEELKNIITKDPYNIEIRETNNKKTNCPISDNLILLHNLHDKSDFSNDFVRFCNGVIIDKTNLKVVCYSFIKFEDDTIIS